MQMSYSNHIPYQNAAVTRTCDEATTILPPLQPLLKLSVLSGYVTERYWASTKVNVMQMYSKGTKCYNGFALA